MGLIKGYLCRGGAALGGGIGSRLRQKIKGYLCREGLGGGMKSSEAALIICLCQSTWKEFVDIAAKIFVWIAT